MARCSSASCHRCNPPSAKERRALTSAIEAVENETPKGRGDYWEPLSSHEDFYTPEFQAMQSAYEAGMRRALEVLRDELKRYED